MTDHEKQNRTKYAAEQAVEEALEHTSYMDLREAWIDPGVASLPPCSVEGVEEDEWRRDLRLALSRKVWEKPSLLPKERITQILPAPGWRWRFHGKSETYPLIGWALYEPGYPSEHKQKIGGLVPKARVVNDASTRASFILEEQRVGQVEYIPPGDDAVSPFDQQVQEMRSA